MKNFTLKLVLTVLFFTAIQSVSYAQPYKIHLYNSYVFDDGIEFVTDNNRYINGTINGGYQWGIGFEYILQNSVGLELMYNRQNTTFPITYSSATDTTRSYDVDVNYILFGSNKYFPIANKMIKPFGGAAIGLAILNNQNPLPGGESSSTKFAWSARLGSDFMFSPSVGIRIQGQVQSAVQDVGGGLYLGTGGVSTGVNTESSMYQFGLGGSLIIQFGAPKTTRRK